MKILVWYDYLVKSAKLTLVSDCESNHSMFFCIRPYLLSLYLRTTGQRTIGKRLVNCTEAISKTNIVIPELITIPGRMDQLLSKLVGL